MGSAHTVVNIRSLAFLFILFTTILFPLQTNAGVVSFISNLISGTSVSAEEIEIPTNSLALLQAPLSPLSAQEDEGDIEIVDDTALVPDTGMPIDGRNVDSDQISIYVVRSGDTLPAIAKMFGVTVNTIRWANDINGNSIKVGQTLVILPISGIQHVVKKGDTLQSIAKQHKGDLEEIMQYNNLAKNARLVVGDIITVPDGEMVATPTPSKPNNSGNKNPTYAGYYMRPIVGGIKSQGIHGKNGVDLVSYYGANILASASGEVIVARGSGYNGGYGLYVVLKHDNGTQTLYAHLSSVNVSVGQKVSQGDVLGKMGSTGKSTGTHLHFEIRGARNPF